MPTACVLGVGVGRGPRSVDRCHNWRRASGAYWGVHRWERKRWSALTHAAMPRKSEVRNSAALCMRYLNTHNGATVAVRVPDNAHSAVSRPPWRTSAFARLTAVLYLALPAPRAGSSTCRACRPNAPRGPRPRPRRRPARRARRRTARRRSSATPRRMRWSGTWRSRWAARARCTCTCPSFGVGDRATWGIGLLCGCLGLVEVRPFSFPRAR